MKTETLNYDLPPELIAQHPLKVRSDSRLLVLNRCAGDILDSRFSNLGDFLSPGDCLVLNDTKVMPARFFARRGTGGRLEGLLLDENADGVWTVYLKGARKVKTGERDLLCALVVQRRAFAPVDRYALCRGYIPYRPGVRRHDDLRASYSLQGSVQGVAP